MRRFYIEHPDSSTVTIEGPDANHIRNVLRLKSGDKIQLFDGKGNEYESIINAFSPKAVSIEILRKFRTTAESPLQIDIAQALLKENKMDNLVRQLTELGITGFHPFIAGRSVPRPDTHRFSTRINRWEKIAKESLKQCNRSSIPGIGPLLSYEEILAIRSECDLGIIFWEKERRPLDASFNTMDRPLNRVVVILGPEGGFTEDEIEKAKASGFSTAALGPRILKADTASIVACALVQYLFGDMGNKST